jgi:hypothetical protein
MRYVRVLSEKEHAYSNALGYYASFRGILLGWGSRMAQKALYIVKVGLVVTSRIALYRAG